MEEENTKKQKLETYTYEDIVSIYNHGLSKEMKEIQELLYPKFECLHTLTEENKVFLLCGHYLCYDCFKETKPLVGWCPICHTDLKHTVARYKGTVINHSIHQHRADIWRGRRGGKTECAANISMAILKSLSEEARVILSGPPTLARTNGYCQIHDEAMNVKTMEDVD